MQWKIQQTYSSIQLTSDDTGSQRIEDMVRTRNIGELICGAVLVIIDYDSK
jgi:hypothetical protein